MKNMLFHAKLVAATALLVFITGCAVPLTPEAEKVRLVTASEKERCERIKMIAVSQRIGSDKPVNAMKSALNEAAVAGANGFYVVSTSMELFDGASVVGEALRCKS